MQVYQQAPRVHEPIRIRGCKDVRIQARTHEPKDMRMQGYKHLHKV